MQQKNIPEHAGSTPATHTNPQDWRPAGVQSKPEEIPAPENLIDPGHGCYPGCCPSPLPNLNDR